MNSNSIRALSEQILRMMNGGNVPRDTAFSEQDIHYLVRDSAAKLIKGEWFSERNEGGKDIDSRYVVTFPKLEVKVDAVTKENYIDMPVATYIRLPYGAGIRSIRPDNSATTTTKRTKALELRAFIPIPNNFEDIYFALPVASLEGIFGWMVRGTRIIFTKRYDQTLLEYKINQVIMDIVSVDPKAVAIDVDLPLSGELILQLKSEVIQMLKLGMPQIIDVIDDQNPNILRAE